MQFDLPEHPTFHPGRMPEPSPNERRRRRLRPTVLPPTPRTAGPPQPSVFDFSAPILRRRSWCLLPSHAIPEHCVLPLSVKSLTEAWKSYTLVLRHPPSKPSAMEKAIPGLKEIRQKSYGSQFMLKNLADAIHKNQFVRHQMMRLLAKWRRSRLQEGNSVDLVTMEFPTTPIRLVDWTNRRSYVFEARSLYKDCIGRLLHSDLEFPDPKPPRNPYTNIPLTLGQLHDVTQALRRCGLSHWTLDALQKSSYDLNIFALNFDVPLKHDALRRTLSNPTEEDCVNLVFEFIEREHDNHDQPFNKGIYIWALREEANCDKMIKWRNLCRRYYTILIECRDLGSLNAKIQADISQQTEGLCGPPADLIVMRNTANRKALLRGGSA